MARPRKSTAENLKRQYRTNAGRIVDRLGEPVPDGKLGKPPAYLSKARQAIWISIAKQVPKGVATSADAIAFEVLVELVEKQRSNLLSTADRPHLFRLLEQFGLTPASRSKVSAVRPPEKKTDEWEDFK